MSQFEHSGGYANPREAIRIQLVRDEEAVTGMSDIAQVQPPAYGLWRESVRVDPNRIFWQRNTRLDGHVMETATPSDLDDRDRPPSFAGARDVANRVAGDRPPSFASDDGVAYVINALPEGRYTASTNVRRNGRWCT